MFDDLIEVIFDETDKTFHAFWRPPMAIGAGKTEEAALHDLRDAIEYCMNVVIDSRFVDEKE